MDDVQLKTLQQQSTERLAKCASLQLFNNTGSTNDMGYSEDLAKLKARFEALSNQFLFLDKKKRFLEIISSSQAVDLDSQGHPWKNSSQQAEDSKKNLRSLHQEIQRMQEDCSNFYGALVSAAKVMPSSFQRLAEQKEALVEMRAELDRLINSERVFERKTLKELQPVLAEKLKQKTLKDQENSQKTALLNELRKTVEEKRGEITALQDTVNRLESKARSGRETVEQRKSKRRDLAEWFENARTMLEKLFGSAVEIDSENCMIKVRFGPLRAGLWVTCEIQMDAKTADIVDVKISPRPYPIDDLVQQSRKHKDIGILVRALHRRVYNFWAREEELMSLIQGGWSIDYDPLRDPDVIKANINGKMVVLQLSRDYPRLSGAAIPSQNPASGGQRCLAGGIELRAVESGTEIVSDELMDRMKSYVDNQCGGRCLKELLESLHLQ